jgi:glycerate kinase
VVGEGRLDEQSLHGKAPVGVAARTPPGVPVVAVSGSCTVRPDRLRDAGIVAGWTLLDEAGGDLQRAIAEAEDLLVRVGRRMAVEEPLAPAPGDRAVDRSHLPGGDPALPSRTTGTSERQDP